MISEGFLVQHGAVRRFRYCRCRWRLTGCHQKRWWESDTQCRCYRYLLRQSYGTEAAVQGGPPLVQMTTQALLQGASKAQFTESGR